MVVKTFSLLALGCYVVLSFIDFLFTFALIQLSGGLAYESNPIAAACLDRHGWYGLAAFKAIGVLIFVSTVAYLTFRKRWIGATLAAFGCVVLFSVVCYTHRLIGETRQDIATRSAAWETPPRDLLQDSYLGLFAKR